MSKVSGYSLRKWVLGALMLTTAAAASAQYQLKIFPVDRDSLSSIAKNLGLQQEFPSRLACTEYINKLPAILMEKGYPTASVDSMAFDSASAMVKIFFGQAYRLANINTSSVN